MSESVDRRTFSKIMSAGMAGMALPRVSFGSSGRSRPASSERPNIVLITADDLGYNHLGCYGQDKIRTPRIDELARRGMRCTQSYAGAPLCAASRSCLLTGTHTGHTSVRGNSGGIPLLPEDITMAEVLQQAGYTTGCFGKWGLGDARTTGVPSNQGFDEYFCTLDQVQAHYYYPEYLWYNDEKYPLPGNEGDGREQYSNDLFTEFALEFIQNQSGADEPFFAYVPYTIPHTELLVPEDSMQEYLNDDGSSVFPETPFEYQGHYAGQDKPHAAFAAMITRMDGYVGQIMDLLDEQGMADNTLIIFSSDNGGQQSGAGVDLDFFNGNWPLKGAKGDLYEGGIRVPTIAHWPGMIEEGSVSNQVLPQWDLMATFADAAGTGTPQATDGLSMLSALQGDAAIDRDHLYWEVDYRTVTGPDGETRPNPDGSLHQAVRMGDWKAVRPGRGEATELYHLPTDLGEKFNVASQYPDQVARAEGLFESSRVEARPQIEPETDTDKLYR